MQQAAQSRTEQFQNEADIRKAQAQINALFDFGKLLDPTWQGTAVPVPASGSPYPNGQAPSYAPPTTGTGGVGGGNSGDPRPRGWPRNDGNGGNSNQPGDVGYDVLRDREGNAYGYNYRTDTVQNPFAWKPGTTQGFNGNFYDGYRTRFVDYYAPQIQRQFTDARDQLAFALARAGLSRSSVAANRGGKLATDLEVQNAGLGQRAQGAVNDLRSGVENARSDLLRMAESASDPSSVANVALARSATLASPAVNYSPLGDLFSGIASGIGSAVQGLRTADLYRTLGSVYGAPGTTGGTGSYSYVQR